MKTFTRILALLITLTLVLGCVIGCKKTPDPTPDPDTDTEKQSESNVSTDTEAQTGGGTVESETTGGKETESDDDDESDPIEIEEFDFGGKTIVVYVNNYSLEYDSSYKFIVGPDSITGNGVSDAVYARNKAIKDDYNLNVEFVEISKIYGDIIAFYRPYLEAGDETMDLILGHLYPMANLSLEGHFKNIANNEYMNYFKSYWYAWYMDTLSLDGGSTNYLMAGDYFMDVMRGVNVLTLNRTLMNNIYGKADIYDGLGGVDGLIERIDNGEWYFENLLEITNGAYADSGTVANEKDGEDRYGWASHQIWAPTIPLVLACDINYVTENAEGYLEIDMNNDESIELLDNLNKLFRGAGAPIYMANGNVEARTPFNAGKTLIEGFYRFANMEDMVSWDVDWTVIPYPKLNDEQESYLTPSHDTVEVGAVPRQTRELDTVLHYLEIAGQFSGRDVMPEFYDNSLKSQFSADPQVASMVTIIHDNVSGAFPLAYSNFCGENLVKGIFYYPVVEQNVEFASNYASLESETNASLKSMLDFWNNIDP